MCPLLVIYIVVAALFRTEDGTVDTEGFDNGGGLAMIFWGVQCCEIGTVFEDEAAFSFMFSAGATRI